SMSYRTVRLPPGQRNLEIRSYGGDDVIEVPPEVDLNIRAYAGSGDDNYFGGGHPGASVGGSGDDYIDLGDGDDVAFAGAGDVSTEAAAAGRPRAWHGAPRNAAGGTGRRAAAGEVAPGRGGGGRARRPRPLPQDGRAGKAEGPGHVRTLSQPLGVTAGIYYFI